MLTHNPFEMTYYLIVEAVEYGEPEEVAVCSGRGQGRCLNGTNLVAIIVQVVWGRQVTIAEDGDSIDYVSAVISCGKIIKLVNAV